MLPRVVVSVRKAVRRLRRQPDPIEPNGAEIEARWHQMIYEVRQRDREAERRMAAAEQALNRRNRS